jgi:hypothetical protein
VATSTAPTLWASTAMSGSAMPCVRRMCSMKVCTSRTLVAKLGLSPRRRRLAMAAGVPGEEVEAGQVQLVGQVGHAPAVLVAAVEHHGAARLVFCAWRASDGRTARRRHGWKCSLRFAHGNILWQRGLSGFGQALAPG